MEKGGRRNHQSFLKKGVVISVIALGIIAFFYFDVRSLLTLSTLRENKVALVAYARTHRLFSVVIFILMYFVQTALAVPGVTILTLTGGFLFGTVLGTLYVSIGATFGATGAFLIARYLFRDFLNQKLGQRLKPIQDGFAKDAFHYLLFIRLMPLFPFNLINLACGLTSIPLKTYILGSAIGMLPATLIVSFAGSQIETIQSVQDIFSPRVVSAFILMGLLVLIPVWYKRRMKGHF